MVTNKASLVELVDEEGVEEVALGEAPQLAHPHISLLTQNKEAVMQGAAAYDALYLTVG